MKFIEIVLASSLVSVLISGIFQVVLKYIEINRYKKEKRYYFLKKELEELTSPENFNNYIYTLDMHEVNISRDLKAVYREYCVFYERVKADLSKKDVSNLETLRTTDNESFMDLFYEILRKEVSDLRK